VSSKRERGGVGGSIGSEVKRLGEAKRLEEVREVGGLGEEMFRCLTGEEG